MYKVGKYKYKSAESYQMLLGKLWFIFLVLQIILIGLRPFMMELLYWLTFFVGLVMLIHLPLKFFDAKGKFKYPFNNY